jgi:hypothetical protein
MTPEKIQKGIKLQEAIAYAERQVSHAQLMLHEKTEERKTFLNVNMPPECVQRNIEFPVEKYRELGAMALEYWSHELARLKQEFADL